MGLVEGGKGTGGVGMRVVPIDLAQTKCQYQRGRTVGRSKRHSRKAGTTRVCRVVCVCACVYVRAWYCM